MRGEVVTKTRSGRTNPSSNKGSGSSTSEQRAANPPSTFEDYVDEGRDYIGSSRISMENIEKASNNLGVKSSDQVATRIIQIQIKKRTQVWTTAPKLCFGGRHMKPWLEKTRMTTLSNRYLSLGREEDARRRREKDKADDESLMKLLEPLSYMDLRM
ncbi:hypothetical protein Bca52824_074158 [Brassica carinata]|uniref:Uncharacterized protein n=1 Tax=Brassica carinata TaxID=52824 RepID=A0A8X7QB88_BRACI|nr:hypothetical protein Bca52824_074158 [Brassica carinata]